MDVYLRDWLRSDAKALYVLCLDESLRKVWNHTYQFPETEKKAKECIDFYRNANPIRFRIFAIVYNQQVCGYIQCEVKGYGSAEIAYWLGEEYRQLGIMKEAVSMMCKCCFRELSIATIYARVAMKNIASQHVLLANQFQESKETAPIYMYFLHHINI